MIFFYLVFWLDSAYCHRQNLWQAKDLQKIVAIMLLNIWLQMVDGYGHDYTIRHLFFNLNIYTA